MTERGFSDEDLALFLDGEAPDGLTREIETALAQDPSLAAELDSLRAAEAAFVSAQENLLSLAPATPNLPRHKARAPALAPAFAGLAAGLVIAATVSWSLLSKPEPGWREVVANYQSLYVTETLSGVTEPQGVSEAKLIALSEVLGLDLTNLPEVDGLAYRRAQQLGYKGAPLAQLTFLTANGGPVALCILRTGGADTSGIETDTLDGMAAYSWVDNGFGVLLIGPLGDNTLSEAAQTFRAALNGAPA
ncbi:MAG: hypothetical protein AAFO72_04175 [Pseudomonadota bacterium]